jgi:hypothetical protein
MREQEVSWSATPLLQEKILRDLKSQDAKTPITPKLARYFETKLSPVERAGLLDLISQFDEETAHTLFHRAFPGGTKEDFKFPPNAERGVPPGWAYLFLAAAVFLGHLLPNPIFVCQEKKLQGVRLKIAASVRKPPARPSPWWWWHIQPAPRLLKASVSAPPRKSFLWE